MGETALAESARSHISASANSAATKSGGVSGKQGRNERPASAPCMWRQPTPSKVESEVEDIKYLLLDSFCSWWSCSSAADVTATRATMGEAGEGKEGDGGNEPSIAATGQSPNSSFEQINHDVERLLSERLLQGFCLLERACPSCATPLVKQDLASAAIIDKYNLRKSDSGSTSSISGTLQPVPGVAYCVMCQAHVVTCAAEMEIRCHREASGWTRGSLRSPARSFLPSPASYSTTG